MEKAEDNLGDHQEPCFLSQGFSLAWNAPIRLGWLATEPQEPTHLALGLHASTSVPGSLT